MRIVLLGGGTGGHFYPLIAVAEAIEDLCVERTLLEPELYYIGPPPFDPPTLLEHGIIYKQGTVGKIRRWGSVANVFDALKTLVGIMGAIPHMFSLYPDVIFSTGGYAAFPTLVAARVLRIPVIIYDADAQPGRVSLWSARFARAIAVAHPEAAAHFPMNVRDKIARVGHPIRKEILGVAKEGGWNGGYGSYIVIEHPNGAQTLYGHASRVIVGDGDHVVQGQIIGYVGSTGKSTGAHVHFEIRNGIKNPF